VSEWPVEEIPDDGVLFRLVRKQGHLYPSGQAKPSAFSNAPDGGMSTEWNKYADAQDTKKRAAVLFRKDPDPAHYAVVALRAVDVRALKTQEIRHTPRPSNRSHTDVFGEKDNEIRVKLARIASLVIPPG
jgi:hypothetical protein